MSSPSPFKISARAKRALSLWLIALCSFLLLNSGHTPTPVHAQNTQEGTLPSTKPPGLLLYIAIDDTWFGQNPDPDGRRFDAVRQIIATLAADQATDHRIGIVTFDVASGNLDTQILQPHADWLTPLENSTHLMSVGKGFTAQGQDLVRRLDGYRTLEDYGRTFTSMGSALELIEQDLFTLDATTTVNFKPVILLLTGSPIAYTGFLRNELTGDATLWNRQIGRVLEGTSDTDPGLLDAERRFSTFQSDHCAHVSEGEDTPFVHAAFTFGEALTYADPDNSTTIVRTDGRVVGSLYANRWATRDIINANPLVYPLTMDGTSNPERFTPEEAVIGFLREIRCTIGGVVIDREQIPAGNAATTQQYRYRIPTSNAAQQITLFLRSGTSTFENTALNELAQIRTVNGGEIKVIPRPADGWGGDLVVIVSTTSDAVIPIWYDYAVDLSDLSWRIVSRTENLPPGEQITVEVQLLANNEPDGIPISDDAIVGGLVGTLIGSITLPPIEFRPPEAARWSADIGQNGSTQAGTFEFTLSAKLTQALGKLAAESTILRLSDTESLVFASELSVNFRQAGAYNPDEWECVEGVQRVDVQVGFGRQNSEISIESLASYAEVQLWFTPPPPVAGNTPPPSPSDGTPQPSATPVVLRWDASSASRENAYFYGEIPCGALPPGRQSMIVVADISQSGTSSDGSSVAKLAVSGTDTFLLPPSATPTASPTFTSTPIPRVVATAAPNDPLQPMRDDLEALIDTPAAQSLIIGVGIALIVGVSAWGFTVYKRNLPLRNILIQVDRNGERTSKIPLLGVGLRRELPRQRFTWHETINEKRESVFTIQQGRSRADVRIVPHQANLMINGVTAYENSTWDSRFPVVIEWLGNPKRTFTLDDPRERQRADFRAIHTQTRQR